MMNSIVTAQTSAFGPVDGVPSVAAGNDAPGGAASQRTSRVPSGLVLAWSIAAVLAVTFALLVHWGLYLNSDGGNYLGDADALTGHGVRDLRHLPAFPTLLLIVRHGAGNDLVALAITMGVIVAALALAFYLFVRGRTGNRWAEVAGTVLFALSPVLGEGIAWYGASMLLGLAFSIAAMRLVDDALVRPRVRTVLAAGALCAGVALSHPFSLLFLIEVTALAVSARAVAAGVRRRRGLLAPRALGARAAGCVAIVVCVLLALFVGRSFYGSVQNPVSLSIDFSRLHLLTGWALRDDTPLWLALAGASLFLIPGGWWLARERGMRLGIWASAVAVASLGNVVALGGAGDYVTRNLYAFPIVLATTFAMAVATVVIVTRRLAARHAQLRRTLVALPVAAVLGIGAHAYVSHMVTAVPYYNTVTPDEYDAIQWLSGREGTIVVTAKGGYVDAGTLYAWMIEGLAHVRAIGTGTDRVNLLPESQAESSAAAQVISGDLATARAQNVHYLFTWRATGMVDSLAAQPCDQIAYANNQVVIASMDTACALVTEAH